MIYSVAREDRQELGPIQVDVSLIIEHECMAAVLRFVVKLVHCRGRVNPQGSRVRVHGGKGKGSHFCTPVPSNTPP